MRRRDLFKGAAALAAGLLVPEPPKVWALDRTMYQPEATRLYLPFGDPAGYPPYIPWSADALDSLLEENVRRIQLIRESLDVYGSVLGDRLEITVGGMFNSSRIVLKNASGLETVLHETPGDIEVSVCPWVPPGYVYWADGPKGPWEEFAKYQDPGMLTLE